MTEARKLLLQGSFALAVRGVPGQPVVAAAGKGDDGAVRAVRETRADRLAVALLSDGVLFVVLVGNAVNITDGLDGLAIVPSVFGVSVLGASPT